MGDIKGGINEFDRICRKNEVCFCEDRKINKFTVTTAKHGARYLFRKQILYLFYICKFFFLIFYSGRNSVETTFLKWYLIQKRRQAEVCILSVRHKKTQILYFILKKKIYIRDYDNSNNN